MSTLSTVTATIAAGESLSSAADCSAANRVCRVIMPSNWPGNDLTFQLSMDGATFHDLFFVDPKTLVSYEVTVPHPGAGIMLTFPPGLGNDVAWVKVRSGSSGIPKPVPADCEFQLVMEMQPASAA
jgi:hypothetical protein